MEYPKISIVILNWNGFKDTAECLDSLKKITYPNYEVIVVDNGSDGNDADILEKEYGNYIDVLRSGKNLGFAGGNNIGIKWVLERGGSDYILLLNNDTTVSPDFLGEMVKVGEENEKTGMIGGKIYYYHQPGKIWFGGGKMNLLTLRVPHETAEFSDVKPVDFITGCLMLIKTAVFKKIGLLNEDYFLTVEDWDFSYRVGRSFDMKITPQAVIYHKVSVATGGERSPLQMYYCHRNRWIFMNNFVKNPFKKTIAATFFFLSFLKAVVLLATGRRIKADIAIINATADAIKGKNGKKE